MERNHRRGVKTKAGKSQFDATKLLGVKLDAIEEEDFNDEEIEALEGMDIEVLDETAKEMQRQGMSVPEMVLQVIAKAKAKHKKDAKALARNKIELRDNQGKDMTRIVASTKTSLKRLMATRSTCFPLTSILSKILSTCATS